MAELQIGEDEMERVSQHEHIKWALGVRGSSISDVARSLDVSPTSVSLVSKGRSRSKRIEEALAKEAGFTPAQLWPSHYGEQTGGAT